MLYYKTQQHPFSLHHFLSYDLLIISGRHLLHLISQAIKSVMKELNIWGMLYFGTRFSTNFFIPFLLFHYSFCLTDSHLTRHQSQSNNFARNTTSRQQSIKKRSNLAFSSCSSSSTAHSHSFTQTLLTLHLSWNNISDQGTEYLSNALFDNKVTFYLQLSSLTHYFIQALLTLGLEGIHVGDQGAQHLADALIRNTVT